MRTPDDESPEKLRGGFYTPKHIAGFLAKWAATGARHTLEPSAGDGVFLKVMSELELPPQEVTAIELDSVEAGKAKQNNKRLRLSIELWGCASRNTPMPGFPFSSSLCQNFSLAEGWEWLFPQSC